MSPTRSSIWVFLILGLRKGANAAALFILAGVLGASDLGAYSFVISVLTVLSVCSLFGAERLSAREIARYLATSSFGMTRGFLVGSSAIVIGSSVLLTLASLLLLARYGFHLDSGVEQALKLGLLFLPALTILMLFRGYLRGFQKAVLSHVGESIIRPLVLVGLLVVFSLSGLAWTPTLAVGCYVAASVVALIVALIYVYKHIPRDIFRSVVERETGTWFRSGTIFMAISLFTALNTEGLIILLGLLSDTTETGMYKLANNLAGLISFVLVAINVPLGPSVARQIALNERDNLQGTVTSLAHLGFFLAAPMALACWLFGDYLLSLFGAEFIAAYPVLVVLAIGQLALVAMGSVASVLVNAGREGLATRSIIIGTATNLILALLLVPFFGATGAAISFTTGGLGSNALMVYYTFSRVGINTTIFAFGRPFRQEEP